MILVTGAAGFIGYHVAQALLDRGATVLGIDNLDPYYEVSLKEARLARLRARENFHFRLADIDREAMLALPGEFPEVSDIVHLAAQAGVRHSLTNPYVYVQSNLMGQVVMLELARTCSLLRHFVYASSSSVYGANTKLPFAVEDAVTQPNSLYAATKRADELIGHTYAHLYGLPATALRFFTVYGPWVADMALFLFTRAILADEPIRVFNSGEMWRDFTYIDDIVNGVLRALDRPPAGAPPHATYNLGNHRSEKLTRFIALLRRSSAEKRASSSNRCSPAMSLPPTQISRRAAAIWGLRLRRPSGREIPRFVRWYRSYYNQ